MDFIGNSTVAAPIFLVANATISTDNAAASSTLNGTITGSGNTLTVAGAGYTQITGTIATGTGGVTMNGVGTLELDGSNTYTGATTINSGTVLAAGTPVGRRQRRSSGL